MISVLHQTGSKNEYIVLLNGRRGGKEMISGGLQNKSQGQSGFAFFLSRLPIEMLLQE